MIYSFSECEEILHIMSNPFYDDEETDDEDSEEEYECKVTETKQSIEQNSSPKVQKLLSFLKEFVSSRGASEMKGLLFVKRRHTAKTLYHIIKRYAIAADLPIRPDFMVGTNARIPESIEEIIQENTNRRVFNKFSKNGTNIIVTSLEEGIDLQECNLVALFDMPTSFRAYVQTRGRARMPNSVTDHYVHFYRKN